MREMYVWMQERVRKRHARDSHDERFRGYRSVIFVNHGTCVEIYVSSGDDVSLCLSNYSSSLLDNCSVRDNTLHHGSLHLLVYLFAEMQNCKCAFRSTINRWTFSQGCNLCTSISKNGKARGLDANNRGEERGGRGQRAA